MARRRREREATTHDRLIGSEKPKAFSRSFTLSFLSLPLSLSSAATRSFSLTRGSAVWSECSCIPFFQDLWLEDGDADCAAGDGERCLTASSRIQTGTDGSGDANPASDETS